jgi:class 3 adenylate cyclase
MVTALAAALDQSGNRTAFPTRRHEHILKPMRLRGLPLSPDHHHGRLFSALLRIGADPADDEDLRLRKLLILSAAIRILPAAVAWGAIYWVFGEPLAASVPWTYAVIGSASIGIFAVSRDYRWFATSQLVLFMILPFALMWILGGFVSGSAVALWAWLAPLGARIVGHRRSSMALLLIFGIGIVLSAALRPMSGTNNLPEWVIVAFYALNVTAVAVVTYALIDASAGGREGSLASMRGIVRRYFSPDVAAAILADPTRQELGGEVTEVTILFADLGGFTSYAGTRGPAEVIELLNANFAAAMPAILAEGGTPVSLPGDGVMAIFGAPRHQLDHPQRAARAALAIQRGSAELAGEHPGWPRFGVGLNTGEALVGNIGSDEFRNFTAIGDTVNMAQRLQAEAESGQVVVGPRTATLLGESAQLTPLGQVLVKGKSEPVEPSALLGLRGA